MGVYNVKKKSSIATRDLFLDRKNIYLFQKKDIKNDLFSNNEDLTGRIKRLKRMTEEINCCL